MNFGSWNNLSNNEKLLAALVAFLAFSSLSNGQPSLFVLLIVLAVLYSLRNASENREERADRSPRRQAVRRRAEQPRPSAEKVHNHALQAVRSAGLDPSEMRVLPVDIGIISFHEDEDPVVHRTWPVDDDCDYVQPFIQLRVPVTAAGKVRFELLDDSGQRIFVHEDRYELKRGRNLIIPSTRLPVHDEQEMNGRWELRVHADNMLLASYQFEWAESESAGFRRHLGEDGEISSELRAVIAESRLGEMSLDELLADQGDSAQPERRQSRR